MKEKEEVWTPIDMDNLPSVLRILEWNHPEYGIIRGNHVAYSPNSDGQSKTTHWVYPEDGSADTWIGEFTGYRKLSSTNI